LVQGGPFQELPCCPADLCRIVTGSRETPMKRYKDGLQRRNWGEKDYDKEDTIWWSKARMDKIESSLS
jgi:hypothetical protein